jgi:hypothetical protein
VQAGCLRSRHRRDFSMARGTNSSAAARTSDPGPRTSERPPVPHPVTPSLQNLQSWAGHTLQLLQRAQREAKVVQLLSICLIWR